MSDATFYPIIAWSLLSLIVGVCIGIWLDRKLAGRVSNTDGSGRARRGLFAWARGDVDFKPPAVKETFVRRESVNDSPDVEELVYAEGSTLTFTLATELGQRDVVFKTREVSRFMRCDTPARSEWRGDNGTYAQLLAVAKHYQWLYRDGNGYCWANFLSDRSRRLRALNGWATR